MLENFHLVAIVRRASQMSVLEIPLHQKLQSELAENLETQYTDFIVDIEEIDFNAGYTPEKHECFRILHYNLPTWLATVNVQTVSSLASLSTNETSVDFISGIVAITRDTLGKDLMLFQNFTRSRVIRPNRFMLLQNGIYRGVEHPGLTLAGGLSAVYQPSDRKLLFRNFRTVNTFLPLSDYFTEASEKVIREILEHEKLVAEDSNTTVSIVDQWFRKRFAMLKDSGVLDDFSIDEIQAHSKGHDVSIKVLDGKIVFPADKLKAKRLLQFLNEEVYLGAITETLYETNSKRKAI